MAKYLIAEGITFFGDNRVVDERELGTPVRAAVIEQRWAPSGEDAVTRNGDRLYVATGSDVRAYDLVSRQQVGQVSVPGVALAVDPDNHALYIADAQGNLWRATTDQMDQLRYLADTRGPATPTDIEVESLGQIGDLDGNLTSLFMAGDGLVALTDADEVVGVDPDSGAVVGRTNVTGAADVASVDAGQRLVVDMSQVTDLESLVTNLATFTGKDINQFRAQLAGRTGKVALAGYLGESDVAQKIEDAGLVGAAVESGKGLAVAGSDGISFIDAQTFDPLTEVATDAPITGFAYVDRAVDKPTLYAESGGLIQLVKVPGGEAPSLSGSIPMPGTVTKAVFNPATELIHVLGRTPDGSSSTVYVIEPHANSVYADARLPFDPTALLMDTQLKRPADNRNDVLAFSSTGDLATVDAGSNAFSWRIMGVIAGAVMAACLYLLARFLFRRRSVAILAAMLVLLDGMAFANARIAMNDTYVAALIVAAVTLFAPVWLGRWRNPWAVGAALIGVGVLLGLALASKWVGAYAIGGIVLLVLLRSALGRVIALLGMVGLTASLGYLAIQPDGNGSTAGANITFLVMMIGLTCLLAVAMAFRPMKLSKDELRFAVIGPIVLGGLLVLAGLLIALGVVTSSVSSGSVLVAGAALVLAGAAAFAVARFAGDRGMGPLAEEPRLLEPGEEPSSPPPAASWLKPGAGPLGIAWLAALGSLVVIPIVLYIWSYGPWVAIGGRWADSPDKRGVADSIVQLVATPLNLLVPGLEKASETNTGQTFVQLQLSMYDYHNNLRATHPATSPWWAWPLDLKPVWFQQGDYAAGTASSIYDSGNLVIFWLAIPAFALLCWQAWKRRSLPLTLVALMALTLWLPWVRIDRATFQYHFFTVLPFTIIGLAYFLAELWHGPSRRTWLLARVSAAIAILGPALLWLLRQPLCGLAGTQRVNPNTEACGATSRNLALTDLQVVALLVAVGGMVALGWLIWSRGKNEWVERNRLLLMPLVLVGVMGGLVLALVGAMIPGNPVFQMGVGIFELPLLLTVLGILAVPAYYVLVARDARRFAVSAVVVAALWFVLFYPNFSGLPVPSTVLNLVNNALSPTYNWGFQFAVNQAPASTTKADLIQIGLLAAVLLVLVGAAYYAARSFRRQRAEERTVTMVDARQTG
jgi:4-amino-4-deoxy-L-arabinose transferase-like glycosyltransferase